MPTRSKKPCSAPGCAQLVDSGYCAAHRKRKSFSGYDNSRGTAAQRGYDFQWQKFRGWYLSQPENILCGDCRRKAAVHVHHVRKLIDRPELKYELDNLMPLCAPCHSVRSARGE